ncbi:DUF4269 domain-containing protein [Flammeovirga sp. SJP92]|uniref:DUF4269 domain-containing protein n=1 Tax=Flammeovirga sp. SJP92 TaxID=1775430 RepID=UPI000788B30A|nr:DUF4269 domain-containing protein [Flammeovirga sp. SJP92]KXX72182.1 diadenosine tetraphosphate hydrolase [Flammeovirga sp. SJP92]
MIDFKNIEYLKEGNPRQKEAFKALKKYKIFERLADYNPLLTGTIPIGIDLPESDLDVICSCSSLKSFEDFLIHEFQKEEQFQISISHQEKVGAVVCSFMIDAFEVEVFGQDKPTEHQNAYRHMLKEHQLLIKYGEKFRQKVIALKEGGLKTEPAFAKLLGLEGDPYQALLNVKV